MKCSNCGTTDKRCFTDLDTVSMLCLRRVSPADCAFAKTYTVKELERYVEDQADEEGLVPCGGDSARDYSELTNGDLATYAMDIIRASTYDETLAPVEKIKYPRLAMEGLMALKDVIGLIAASVVMAHHDKLGMSEHDAFLFGAMIDAKTAAKNRSAVMPTNPNDIQ